jgi:hypothetical protein
MGKLENERTPNDEVCTPIEIMGPIYEHFGPVGLDPFGHPRSAVKAQHYFMLPKYAGEQKVWHDALPERVTFDDAMEQDWDGHGLVFANGPFSKLRTDRPFLSWAEKAAKLGGGDETILLVPCRTGSEWWQRFIVPADVILFWRGRIKFDGEKDSAAFHAALVYWGTRPELMDKAFPRHWRIQHRGD